MRAWLGQMIIVLVVIGGLQLPVGVRGGTSQVDDALSVNRSLAYLQTQAPNWGIQDAYQEFQLRQVVRDSLGQMHIRLDQVHQRVPVFGKQLIVHFDSDDTPRSITGAYLPGIAVSTRPAISVQEARAIARQRFLGPFTNAPETELMLYPQDEGVRLVYRIALEDNLTPRRVVAFVDAASGQLVHSYNDLHTLLPSPIFAQAPSVEAAPQVQVQLPAPTAAAAGVGHSLYSGTVGITTELSNGVYYLIDHSRGDLYAVDMRNRLFGQGRLFADADNTWGDGTNSDRASAGVDAHFGAEMTWDYYLTVHGRTGIKDDGVGALSRVHYRRGYNNANWVDSCRCMTYGDGDGTTFTLLTSLDVAGHEMTHGVTSATANLIYDNQSGGLNEAISDIFGTMVEYFAAAQGATKTPNYLIGEDVYTPGTRGMLCAI